MGAPNNDWNRQPLVQAQIAQAFSRPNNPFSNTYNPDWINHPNISCMNQPNHDFSHGPPKPNKFHANVGPPPFLQALPQPLLQPLALPPPPSFEDKMLNAMGTISQSVSEIKSTIHLHSQSIARLEA